MNPNAQILSKLIDEDFDLNTRDGSRWGNTEDHSSLVLDKERGIFFWNSKGIVGDPLVYLTKVRGLSFERAREYLRDFKEFSGSFVYTIHNEKEDVVVYPKLVDIFFEDGATDKSRRDYFYRRGLTDNTIDRFRLGWYNDFSMIPYFVEGTFRNFQMRRDDGKKVIRHYYKSVGALLFNSDILKVTNKIYVTEGPVDAMVLMQNGIPAVATTTVLPDWYGKFVKQKEIILLYDNDKAGEFEARRSAKILGQERCKIYCFWDFNDSGYDPVDFFNEGNTVESLNELVEKNSKYCFELVESENVKKDKTRGSQRRYSN